MSMQAAFTTRCSNLLSIKNTEAIIRSTFPLQFTTIILSQIVEEWQQFLSNLSIVYYFSCEWVLKRILFWSNIWKESYADRKVIILIGILSFWWNDNVDNIWNWNVMLSFWRKWMEYRTKFSFKSRRRASKNDTALASHINGWLPKCNSSYPRRRCILIHGFFLSKTTLATCIWKL